MLQNFNPSSIKKEIINQTMVINTSSLQCFSRWTYLPSIITFLQEGDNVLSVNLQYFVTLHIAFF